jgi:outer membrane putative beta-barrel porin/alpha-amylase
VYSEPPRHGAGDVPGDAHGHLVTPVPDSAKPKGKGRYSDRFREVNRYRVVGAGCLVKHAGHPSGILAHCRRSIFLWHSRWAIQGSVSLIAWWALASVLPTAACFNQASSTSEIVTDRPDITESSVVIPVGSLQVENGITWSADHGAQTVDLSETLIRVGLLQRTEIRFTPPNYVGGLTGNPPSSGFGTPSVGLKEQLGPLPGAFDLSVIVGSSFPLVSDNGSGHRFSPFVKLPWSHSLSSGWSIGGMQSLFDGTDELPRKLILESTLYVEREVAKDSDVFLEYGADYGDRERSRQVLHVGAAHRIARRQQVDFHFGFGLTHGAPTHFFAAGYSFRIDHLLRRRD